MLRKLIVATVMMCLVGLDVFSVTAPASATGGYQEVEYETDCDGCPTSYGAYNAGDFTSGNHSIGSACVSYSGTCQVGIAGITSSSSSWPVSYGLSGTVNVTVTYCTNSNIPRACVNRARIIVRLTYSIDNPTVLSAGPACLWIVDQPTPVCVQYPLT